MAKYGGKILLRNSKRLLRKLPKILGFTLLPHPVHNYLLYCFSVAEADLQPDLQVLQEHI